MEGFKKNILLLKSYTMFYNEVSFYYHFDYTSHEKKIQTHYFNSKSTSIYKQKSIQRIVKEANFQARCHNLGTNNNMLSYTA